MAIAEKSAGIQADKDEVEIRLSDVFAFLKRVRFTVIIWALGFMVAGGVYSLLLPNQYTTEIKLMPESTVRTGGLGNLSSLAGLAGVDIPTNSPDALRPDLYPTILKSVPFGLYILQQPVKAKTLNKSLTLEEYLIYSSKQGLSSFFSNSEGEKIEKVENYPDGLIALNRQQEAVVNNVVNRVECETDKKSNVIVLSARMPEPEVAAQVANYALTYLTNYVVNYRTGKSRRQVQFLEKQVMQAQRRYQSAENAFASYRDRNRSTYTYTAKVDEQRLQAEFLLTQGLYNELLKQLEQAKIKVQEDAPVFQTLEPARVPLAKSGPKRTVITLLSGVAGAIIGLGVAFIREFF